MRYKEILREKGVTAKELAQKIGVTEVGLSKILTGKTSTSTNMIEKIAAALGIKCGELFDDYIDDKDSNSSNQSITIKSGETIVIHAE